RRTGKGSALPLAGQEERTIWPPRPRLKCEVTMTSSTSSTIPVNRQKRAFATCRHSTMRDDVLPKPVAAWKRDGLAWRSAEEAVRSPPGFVHEWGSGDVC